MIYKTTEEQLEAVRQSPFAIERISNPCLEVQKEAVVHHIHSIFYIKNPCLEVQLLVATNEKFQKAEPTLLSLIIDRKLEAITYSVIVSNENLLKKKVIINLLELNSHKYTEKETIALRLLADSLE